MELRHLRYFLAVAKEGNMTRAAEQLGIAQPPLSMQIKNLEDELGVLLFQRTAHGVVLTPAGVMFEIEAKRTLDNAELAKRIAQQAAKGEIGQLRLGFTGAATFNPIVPTSIRTFKKNFPAVALTLEEINTTYLLQRLLDNHLDTAFIRPIDSMPEGIKLHYLPEEPMVIALPSTHTLARKKLLKITDLAKESFIFIPAAPGTTLYSSLFKLCHEAGFTPQIGQPAPQISSVINLVAAGLGISVVPASLSQIKLKGVCYREFAKPIPTAQLALAWFDENAATVKRLLDIVQHLS
ncbi:LysR family transcriptional regulator [Entomomonas asaccharolytica]|uniref:LysR family transcriptional regulator n=1 Tax=Entomomonas asaccharolytica TaxID=2785331 RepID=A0A974RVU3_9GAMM|nr:LysR family transcriptional regulator [Entomomonas asaccharolytica]QQP84455.1 LysR family transcriptional regulator [Entomomonas asaccharolytica]